MHLRFRRLSTFILNRLDYFLTLLTLSLVGIFYPGPVPIRSAQRWSCCVERDAEVRKACRGLGRLQGSMDCDLLVLKANGAGPRQGERTARVNVRASARTNGGTSATSTNPGTSS